MRGEKMMLDHDSTVGNAVKKGLGPIPGCMEPNGPPEGPGAPKAETENQSSKGGGDESDRRLARILAVTEAEKNREQSCACPEPEQLAVARFEQPGIDARRVRGLT